MLSNRLIPTLLLHDGGLWKTEQFEPVTYVGDPTNAVRIFNDKMADELLVLDIDAARTGRGPDLPLIERMASECFMPLCYGGGIRSLGDAQRLFDAGVEKVAVNTAARRDPELIPTIADVAGRQAVVASVDVNRSATGLSGYDHVTRAAIHGDWTALVARLCRSGAGELLITSVDRDGTLRGPDLPAVQAALEASDIPVIAMGGVRHLADAAALVALGVSAVAAGAMFVYRGPHRAVLISYPDVDSLRRQELMVP